MSRPGDSLGYTVSGRNSFGRWHVHRSTKEQAKTYAESHRKKGERVKVRKAR